MPDKTTILPFSDASNLPSMERVILPSRAFFLSWRDQTLPARTAALDDAIAHYREVAEGDDHGLRDMALLGVVSEAMQSLEDIAYLGTAWDRPFSGLAHYLKVTAYSARTPTNFWGSVGSWDDRRLELFAGLAGRDGDEVVPFIDGFEGLVNMEPDARAAMERARGATVTRLRRLLSSLGQDWDQFSRYFQAFKHGGLAIHRSDAIWVEDEVSDIEADTERHDPSIAVWTRRGKIEAFADFNLSPQELANYISGTGRLAIDLTDAFITSRLFIFEALELGDDGSLQGLRPMQVPWTVWLREQDLDEETWRVLGAGPTITWVHE